MENIFGQVTALVAVIVMVAIFVEAILEAFAPILGKITDVSIKTTINLVLGAILGFGTAALMGLRIENYLTFLPVTVPVVASYILIGCAAGAGGSRFWHAVLGFLSTLHLPTLPTTTTTVTNVPSEWTPGNPPPFSVTTSTAPTGSTTPPSASMIPPAPDTLPPQS